MSPREPERTLRNTTLRVRLRPTPAQAALIERTFEGCRWLWNHILADEQEFFAATGTHFLPTPARYKKEAPFLRELDSQALVTVHQNLRKAFEAFFEDPETYAYPRFKREGAVFSYTVYAHHYFKQGWPSSIRLNGNGVHLPKLGTVKANLHRRPLHWWLLKSATVSRSQGGNYYCSLLYEYQAKQPEREVLEAIAETEDETPYWIVRAATKLELMERRLRRMERGSKNYQEQSQKIRAQREHIANQKRDLRNKLLAKRKSASPFTS